MPRKTTKKNEPQNRKELYNRAKWGDFINVPMTEDDREHFRIWKKEKAETIPGMLDEVCTDKVDLKIYCKWSEGTFVCQMTVVTVPDYKIWVISSFADTPYEALMVALFKHYVLLDCDWSANIAGIGDKPSFG